MATARIHLMQVSLNIIDQPVGYTPPVGPAVRFTVRYGQRDDFQPANRAYSNFGQKWTFDWLAYIQDNPTQPTANVIYYMMGGGYRTFTGFNQNTQTFAYEQYDQTLLTRRATGYEMTARDGSKLIFASPDGATGTTRRVFLTRLIDPAGNAVTLTYDANLRITAITDTIGQVTTLAYENPADTFKITKVTDPFGRAATFGYDSSLRLISITDVAGLVSQFTYEANDFIDTMTTPYGLTYFTTGTSGEPAPSGDPGPPGRIRWLEITYPDGKERVEYNQEQGVNHLPDSDPKGVPTGMSTHNNWLYYRNTFYWDRLANAYGARDYTKATIYHWQHVAGSEITSGILESVKKPLENRVWYDYDGQTDPIYAGSTNKPRHIGRVLDDGSSQLHAYTYNGFGNVTSYVDPLGRTTSYVYDADGIDLLEIHQKTAQGSDLLARNTYNTQHRPLTVTDAAGQTTAYTYNTRGQVLTVTNPRNETTTFTYDPNGYLTSVAGPLPGQITTYTYDSVGRIRTLTDESQYTLTFDYDALDRPTRITYPDSTFVELGYTALDRTSIRDRAGRLTLFEYDRFRQLTKQTDPLGRVTKFKWCKCGDIRSVTDALGRTTSWRYDLQGRVQSKEYADGSTITYRYEDTTSRLRQRIDEQLQVTHYAYNIDDTLAQTAYTNVPGPTPPNPWPGVPTQPVRYTYDPYYNRVTDVANDIHTGYVYFGAGQLGAGRPFSIETTGADYFVFAYDELGRRRSMITGGVTSTTEYDAAGRVVAETNPLGTFTTTYDGASRRPVSRTGPNGLNTQYTYAGPQQDHALLRIKNSVGGTVISQFDYEYDIPTGQITQWTQTQSSSPADANPYALVCSYDAAGQLVDALPYQAGERAGHFWNEYDAAGNRTRHDVNGDEADPVIAYTELSYNALNQLTTIEVHPDGGDALATNQYVFDAEQRLATMGSQQSGKSFEYDDRGRRIAVQDFTGAIRRFVWNDDDICAELDRSWGVVVKRFFPQGMQIVTGPDAGNYYYTRDHQGSIREVLDSAGNVRASYGYTPFGRAYLLGPASNVIQPDFGFAGMFQLPGYGVYFTKHRVYDPDLGRWISRDPLHHAELTQGANLYTYVGNDPINRTDPLGLACCEKEARDMAEKTTEYLVLCTLAMIGCALASGPTAGLSCFAAGAACAFYLLKMKYAQDDYENCLKTCKAPRPVQPPCN
jgi:RHS repeat-associated protein